MEKYAIFFDIDGTLVPENSPNFIPESTIKAIQMAKENGHYVFVNTGRTYAALDPFIKEVSFDGFVCGCGTNIYFHGEELLKKELGHEFSVQLRDDLLACHVDGILEGKHFIYYREECLHPEVERIKHSRDHVKDKQVIEKLWDDEELAFDKMALWIVEDSDFASFRSKYENDFEFIPRSEDFYELIPAGYSKATGMEFLTTYLDIPRERMIAIGDSMNDISMLSYAGISIGMGNSNPHLLDKVSYVTADIMDDGIYKALKHYNIID